MRLLLTPGQAGDAPQAPELLKGLNPQHVVADAAYDSDAIRELVHVAGGKTCIRPNPTRVRVPEYDPERYEHRNVIERFFAAIKRFRRVATRYEKKAANYLGFAHLAATFIQLEWISTPPNLFNGNDRETFGFDNIRLTGDAVVIPEPASPALTGLGGLLLIGRKRCSA